VSHSAAETETLFKNLHTEYQRIRISQHTSGVETVGEPTLRNSEELYVAYDLFYSVYYPQGGSALPSLMMTETGILFAKCCICNANTCCLITEKCRDRLALFTLSALWSAYGICQWQKKKYASTHTHVTRSATLIHTDMMFTLTLILSSFTVYLQVMRA